MTSLTDKGSSFYVGFNNLSNGFSLQGCALTNLLTDFLPLIISVISPEHFVSFYKKFSFLIKDILFITEKKLGLQIMTHMTAACDYSWVVTPAELYNLLATLFRC